MSKKFLYANFNEYAEIVSIDENHPNIEAFMMIWDMARAPGNLLDNCDEEDLNE